MMSKLKRKQYEEELLSLQVELNVMARWLKQSGKRLVVLLEGRDTSGKGGVISAISSCLNPRQCSVVALAKPSEREAGQWYFQRYVSHLPTAGDITLFDRSWYNRAGVEKVMGFASAAQVSAFLKQTPVFERQLVDDGILLFKYWLAVDQAEQEKRFAERQLDPLKRWKLSPIDLEARERYADYGRARDAMFKATHRRFAPWHVVDFNDQKVGRLNLIRHLLDHLPDHAVSEKPLEFPPLKRRLGKEHYNGPVKPIKSRY
jgi:polyphosphate kinase 2